MIKAIKERPSPNFDHRPAGRRVEMLILHYTGMTSAAAALDRLCDPAAKVSAHYMIEEDGTVWRLVPEAMRAWHAGVAFWRGERDINGLSIGIELVNPGHEFGYRPFPEPQMAALETLARDILARHPIPPDQVLGHSDVAPSRKLDPGELFDWPRLARAGIGLWPDGFPPGGAGRYSIAAPLGPDGPAADNLAAEEIAEAQRGLARLGYEIAETGELDAATRCVVQAFQRHFRPERVDGVPDAETSHRLARLLAQLGRSA